MSFEVSDAVERPDAAETEVSPGRQTGRGLAAVVALAPAIAACAGLIVHYALPAARPAPSSWLSSLPAWQHPYPILLVVIILAALVAAISQQIWQTLRATVRHWSPLAAGLIGVIAVWEIVTAKTDWLILPFFPDPDEVAGALVADRSMLFRSACASLILLLSGYAVGAIAGLFSGIVIGWFPAGRYWGTPLLRLLGPVPATAIVPLAMALFAEAGSGATALIAFAVWFPMTMLTSSGIAGVRHSHLDVARTLGAGRAYLIFHVALPSALPNLFVGLFIGLGTASLTLPAAEMLGVQAGLGWYLKWQQSNAEYANVYASLLILALLFSALMTLLFACRDYVLRWQRGVIRW